MDITEALMRLKNQRDFKQEELNALSFAISQLEGTFAPQFAELEQVKASNATLIVEKQALELEKTELMSDLVTPK